MSTEINIKKRIDIQEEGVSITPDVNSINFIGDGVTASAIGDDVTVNIPGGMGTVTYYLNESVTQTPYKEFTSILTASPEQTIVTSIASGATVTIQSFQTPSGVPGTTNIPGGRWAFYLHFSGTTGDSWDVFAEVYKRDLGGIETLLLTTDAVPTSTLTGTAVMLLSDGVFPASTVLTTDRIVVKVKVTNTDVTTNSITFHTEGSTNYSLGTTTLNQVVPTGAVTSVTGTAPVVSSGGTTPAISIPQATTLVDGYLSSSDFAVFNAKVGGSGTLNYVSKFTGTSTLGNSNIFDDGTNVGIGITAPTAKLHINNITAQNSFLVEDSTSPDSTPFVINLNGSVGIGTTTPAYEVDVRSNSPQLRVYSDANARSFRIFPGSGTIESDNTSFYLNRFSTHDIVLGFGGGKVGIGTTTPTAPLQVKGTAIPSAGETIAKFEVSDSSAFLQIGNGTATNGAFAPVIQGRQVGISTQPALQTEGVIDTVDDIGTTPVNIFKARLNTLAQVVTRPVFQFSNWTLDIMTMLANGNVGIGTTTPTEKLEVSGKTKTTTFQMTTTPTAGYVLTSDASGNGTWQANGNGTVTSVELSAGTGISLAGTNPITSSGTITVTNSAPDQTVVLNAGTGIGVTGTYPSFTVSNTDPTTGVTLASAGGTETLVNDGTGPSLATKGITAGTGISLSSTATDLTVTNAAPDQVVALTAGTGINVTGTYPNFTITNTSPSSVGTVTSVAALTLGTTGTDLSSTVANGTTTPIITLNVPTASATNRGALSSADWTAFNDKANTASPAFTGTPTAPTATAGTNTTQVATTAFVQNAISKQPEVIQAAASDETTNLTIGTAKVTFRMPYAMTLTAVRASLTTAQIAGALLTVDINLNGVSVLGTKLTFDNSEKTTVTAATPATIVTSDLTDDGEITVDIDTVGTALAKGLKITLIGTRA